MAQTSAAAAAPAVATETSPATLTADDAMAVTESNSASFDYTHVTSNILAEWHTSGCQILVDVIIKALHNDDLAEVSTIYQELMNAVLEGILKPEDAGNCINNVIHSEELAQDGVASSSDAETMFLDTFSIVCEASDLTNSLYQSRLHSFAAATGISAAAFRQTLDSTLLQTLQFTRSTFVRVGIRKTTALLYRQANYNLLREETEGYSKLVTELFSICESSQTYSDIAGDAFEKIKGLIGTFDLDVGRVLDITLDVFASLLIKCYRFVVKLLRVSSWWPRNSFHSDRITQLGSLPQWALPSQDAMDGSAEDNDNEAARQERDSRFWQKASQSGIDAFFELGGLQTVPDSLQLQGAAQSPDAKPDLEAEWTRVTGTLPPRGNKIAAHVLGFKLLFYASEARNHDDILPDNLIYLTALLIKIGFISLMDLYPHIWPLDEDMEALRESKMQELAQEQANKSGAASNALMRAGALPDDDPLPSAVRVREPQQTLSDTTAKQPADVEDKDKLGAPLEQKVRLLKSLLTIGAIPESLFILSRFPWLPEVYTELYELIHRILNHSLQKVYASCQPPVVDDAIRTKRIIDPDQTGMPKGTLRLMYAAPRSQLRWPFPDKFDTNENKNYRFYWDEWADNVPVCQSIDDVFTLCNSLLNISGVNIGRDGFLLSKLVRIGSVSLAEDQSQANLDRWHDLLKRLLVPALSLTKANTSIANEIYDLLRYYPLSTRYGLYAEWFEGQTSRLPAMKQAFAQARQETLRTMKRISTTNVTAMARALAKIAYASPGIVFSVALTQIEAYTNLTEVVVECAKYFTDLGYDVLVWSLMSSLGGKARNRNNSEFALLPSRWLLALSRFSGKVFRRYSIMNPLPILQYVSHQLQLGSATDLVILQELIQQMAGMVSDTDFTDTQRTALAGGILLRKQTLVALGDMRYESAKTARRLMKALTDTNLAGQLVLSIAQHRQAAIYKIPDDEAPIKLLATMIDDTSAVLVQFLDLLRSNLSVEEFDKYVPSVVDLIGDYGLEPSSAFMIGRASITDQISQTIQTTLNNTKALAAKKVDVDGDTGMKDSSLVLPDDPSAISVPSTTETDAELGEEEAHGKDKSLEVTTPALEVYRTVLEPMISAVKASVSDASWNSISPEFYVTFWTATMSDISIPKQSYDAEISRLLKEQESLMKDRTDMTKYNKDKREELKQTLESTRKQLLAEFSDQVGQFTSRKARLLKRKNFWFEGLKEVKADRLSDAVLERCVLPRALLTPSDTDFCHKMIRFMHDSATPHFRMLSFLGRVFRHHRLRTIIFSCTVREAENFGRYLRLILKDLARWYVNKNIYEKEALGAKKELAGFAVAVDQQGKPKSLLEHDGEKHGFKKVLLVWHKALQSALGDCLDGVEWMHIRNAITVLKTVVDVFPTVDHMGQGLIKKLETIAKREQDVREDLALTANAVLVQLKKRSKQWTSTQAPGRAMVRGPCMSIDEANLSTAKWKPRSQSCPNQQVRAQTNGSRL